MHGHTLLLSPLTFLSADTARNGLCYYYPHLFSDRTRWRVEADWSYFMSVLRRNLDTTKHTCKTIFIIYRFVMVGVVFTVFFLIWLCWCALYNYYILLEKRCKCDRKGSKQVRGQARDYNTDISHKTHHPRATRHIKNNGKMSPSSRHSALILSQKLHWPSLYNDSPSCSVWVCAFVCLFSTVSHSVWISKLWETALLRRQKCRETDSEGADRARNSRSQIGRLFQFSCLC